MNEPNFDPENIERARGEIAVYRNAVGGFMLNMGKLEFASIAWARLMGSEKDVNGAVKANGLKGRIDIVRKVIRSEMRMDADWKKVSLAFWEEVDVLREMRNKVGHSPFASAKTQAGDVHGLFNSRSLLLNSAEQMEFIRAATVQLWSRKADGLDRDIYQLYLVAQDVISPIAPLKT